MTMIPLQSNGCIGHKLLQDQVNNNYSSLLHPLPNELPSFKYYYQTSDSELETDDDFEDYDDDDVVEDGSNPSARLLEFVTTVTNDISLLIHRNKGNEDYCDIYEERFRTSLSGQELYYTDLLELANSNTHRNSKVNRSTDSSGVSSPINHMTGNSDNCNYTYGVSSENGSYQQLCFNGQCVSESGLGPLDELFKKPFKPNKNNEIRNEKNVIPMTMRKLPVSFWQEPGLTSKDSVDFSDLFTQWRNYLDDSSISLTQSSQQFLYNPDDITSETTNMEQAIEKRINKIHKRLKETNRNLKSMEKLMNENDNAFTMNDRTCLLATSNVTKSMHDICSSGHVHEPNCTNQTPNMQSENSQIHNKLSSLENKQTKLQNSMESINKSLDTIKDPLKTGQDQVQSALIELTEQLNSTTRSLKEAKIMYSERERVSKYKAKKSIQSWKNKYESLYVDKKHLDEQLNKCKDQNYLLLRDQEILRLRLEEIQQRIENESKQQIYLNNLLSKCKDECMKKEDSLNLLNSTYNNTKCEVNLLKSELEKLEKTNIALKEQNAGLIKSNLSLEHQLKNYENGTQGDELLQVKETANTEKIKKLEVENCQLQIQITDLQRNAKENLDLKDSKESVKLALKNENLLGELESLKSEFQELKIKHDQVLKNYYVKSEECIGKEKRVLKLEKSVKESCKIYNYKEQEFQMILVRIGFEIDKVANLWNSISGNSASFQELLNLSTPCSSHSKLHLVDIQSKLKVLQDELVSFKNSAAKSNNSPNSAVNPSKNVENLKQNALGKIKTKHYQNQELNIGTKKGSNKVHSTKINPSLLMSSVNENISSYNCLHNSSLTLSSINKSTESSTESSS